MTLLFSILLATSEFWREKVELTLTFFLMLILVPTFFSSLIRKIHGARLVEEERARLMARHESIAARSAFLAKVSHELRSPCKASSPRSTSWRCGVAPAPTPTTR